MHGEMGTSLLPGNSHIVRQDLCLKEAPAETPAPLPSLGSLGVLCGAPRQSSSLQAEVCARGSRVLATESAEAVEAAAQPCVSRSPEIAFTFLEMPACGRQRQTPDGPYCPSWP